MAATAVIFKSKYGATRKYAMHIAQSLEADLFDLERVKKFDFGKYDTIIYGGGLYAGSVNGIKFIASNADKLKGKNLVLFTTGIGDPTVAKSTKVISKSLSKALPEEIMANAHLYSFRGGIDYANLSFMHRMMMSMMYKMIAKKSDDEKTQDDKDIIETYGKAIDYTDLSTASSLIEYVKGLK